MPNLNNKTFAQCVIHDATIKTAQSLKYMETTAKAAAMIETGNTKIASELSEDAGAITGVALCIKKAAAGEVDSNSIDPRLVAVVRDIATLA